MDIKLHQKLASYLKDSIFYLLRDFGSWILFQFFKLLFVIQSLFHNVVNLSIVQNQNVPTLVYFRHVESSVVNSRFAPPFLPFCFQNCRVFFFGSGGCRWYAAFFSFFVMCDRMLSLYSGSFLLFALSLTGML